MRRTNWIALVFVAAASAAQAQTSNLVGGETKQYVHVTSTTGSCYVGRGPSVFQRTATISRAFITFDELWTGGRYDLSGQASLSFITATAGRIAFKNATGIPAAVSAPAFKSYSQVYSAASRRLLVKFTIAFPGCTLLVTGSYDGA